MDEAVAVCGVLERRSDAKLPAHVVAYLTLGLSLFPDDDYEEVAAKVTGRVVGADRQRDHPGPETAGPWGVSRVVRADLRAGGRGCRPARGADRAGHGAWLGSCGALRLLVIDGFELDLPDTPANAAEFGYAGSGANRSAFCKARVVALAECGTHAFLAAEVDGYQSSLGIDRTADSNHAWPPPGDWKACSATGPRGKSAILGHRVGYAALLQRSMDGPGPGGMPGNRSVHFLDRWAAEQT